MQKCSDSGIPKEDVKYIHNGIHHTKYELIT